MVSGQSCYPLTLMAQHNHTSLMGETQDILLETIINNSFFFESLAYHISPRRLKTLKHFSLIAPNSEAYLTREVEAAQNCSWLDKCHQERAQFCMTVVSALIASLVLLCCIKISFCC